MMRLHWTPDQFDSADFFELNRIMTAEKVETADDFRAGGSLTDQQLAERHTNRNKLREQAGVKSLAALVQKHKASLAAQHKSERKEEK